MRSLLLRSRRDRLPPHTPWPLSPLCSALAGFNATIFAYGQTGSGKTFTMTGGTQQYKDRGIIPRCLEYIFEQAKERKGEEFRVFVSYLELYNGQGMDLLTDEFKSGSIGDLPCVEGG